MQDCDPAQARELIRALCDHLREMTHHLARVESRLVPGTHGHPMRLEAAALRRDIAEAQMHVDRLQRRYLSPTTDNQAAPSARSAAVQPDGRTRLGVRR
ncbi:MAG: hypothetical protein WBZ37_14120 [Mycobacterium sp.]